MGGVQVGGGEGLSTMVGRALGRARGTGGEACC